MPPNRYGTQAMTDWRTFLPNRYSELTNPEQYFTDLGLRVETEIADLATNLAGDDPPPPESYLDKVGRLNAPRMRAEEIVLREEVLLEPEPELTQQLEQDEDQDLEEPEETAPAATGSDWIPVVEDPTHPYWQNVRQQRAEDEMNRHLT
jgi:hypothetical protein